MCGIIGYIGEQDAAANIYNGLKKLEYRGYDSCGVVVLRDDNSFAFNRHLCAPSEVEESDNVLPKSNCGIGHTRWATHGGVSLNNAHPHRSCDGSVFLVHNGGIENSDEIKKGLENENCTFYSETDTEALVNLIAFYYNASSGEKSPLASINLALKEVEGTYGVAVMFKDHPSVLFAVRRSSPLVLGLKEGQTYISSDTNALPSDTEKVVYLEDGDVAEVRKDSFKIYDINNKQYDSRRTAIKIKIPKRHHQLGSYQTFLQK